MKLVPATPRLGFFWVFTFLGIVILVAVVDALWHLPAGTGLFGRTSLGLVAAFVVLIWLTYRQLIEALSQLKDQVGEKTFGRLSSSVDFLASSGYFMVLLMLKFTN